MVTSLNPQGIAPVKKEAPLAEMDPAALKGLPGDRITARVGKAKRSFAEARIVSLVTPAANRLPARCAHADQCGGCRMQELPYDEQVRLKERQVAETLRHLGGIADAVVHPIVPAPSQWHYRNKMEFSFLRGDDGTPILGLHERGTFDRVFQLRECWIASQSAGRIG